MSDEVVSQPEDAVSRAEFDKLQEQLKATRAERDREKFEKAEIVAKANAAARERDDAKTELASVLEARDKMIGDIVAEHEKKLADIETERNKFLKARNALNAKFVETERNLADATRRADEIAAEVSLLRNELASKPSSEPLAILWQLLQDQTKAAHDWLRSKMPPDSAILPWFDKIVALSLQVGCTAVKLGKQFIAWATPKAIELFNKGKAEIEARLAKK